MMPLRLKISQNIHAFKSDPMPSFVPVNGFILVYEKIKQEPPKTAVAVISQKIFESRGVSC